MKTSANKELVHYYGQGLPFIKRVDFSAADRNLLTQTITIGGIAYVLDSDIYPSGDDTKRDVVFLISEAINGIGNRKIASKKDNPFAYAKFEGETILLIGRESGTDFTVTFAGYTVDPTVTTIVAGTGGSIGTLMGALTDAPLADGTQASATAASMIALLKTIVNNTADIEVTLENNGTIEVAVDGIEDILNSVVKRAAIVDAAVDKVVTLTYLDAGAADERISTVVTSSASLALSYTDTFVYAGSAGAYRISTITRS